MIGLKGVTKSIVEVRNPDSPYFERIVFYLKPNLQGIPSRAIQSEVRSFARAEQPVRNPMKVWVCRIVQALVWSGIGAIIVLLW